MQKHQPPKGRRRRAADRPEWNQFFSDEEEQPNPALQMSLADAGLSVRVVNTLESLGIFTVGELATKTRAELMEIGNFGEKPLVERRTLMREHNVKHPNWNRPPRRTKRASKRKR